MLFSQIAYSVDSGLIKQTDLGSSVIFDDSKKTTTMIWPSIITPGKNIALTSVFFKEYEEKFYSRYEFRGVVANSMLIKISGSTKPKNSNESISDSSFDTEIYIEKAEDGAFYFLPDDAEGYGVFIITRSKNFPERYSVDFKKTN